MASIYTIDFTDPNKGTLTLPPLEVDGPACTLLPTPSDCGSSPSTSLDITLIGNSHVKWGEYILENMVHMLENFACPSLPSTEIPDTSTSIFALNNPTEGQLWFNTTNKQTYSFDGINWNMLGDIEFSSTIPTSPTYEGKLWYDTASYNSASPEYGRNLKIFDGSTYKEVVDDYLPRDGSKRFLGNIEFDSLSHTQLEIVFPDLLSGGGAIRNLNLPINNSDATNKQYVDTELDKKITKAGDTDIGSLNFLSNATLSFSTPGGQITGLLNPSNNSDAANKQYVDSVANGKLSTNGGVLYGNLSMNLNRITDVLTPPSTYDTARRFDATNKYYVDNEIIKLSKTIAVSRFYLHDSEPQSGEYANLYIWTDAHGWYTKLYNKNYGYDRPIQFAYIHNYLSRPIRYEMSFRFHAHNDSYYVRFLRSGSVVQTWTGSGDSYRTVSYSYDIPAGQTVYFDIDGNQGGGGGYDYIRVTRIYYNRVYVYY